MFGNVSEEEALASVGPGWAPLIKRLYTAKPADVTVVQVKEKFGGLRFYFEPWNVEYGALVIGAERESCSICERCGEPGSLDESRHWLLTLCDGCKAAR